MSKKPTIIYTHTDEAPALATHSLLPIIEAFKKAGRKLLIMHGMIDDNVHPTNAFQLIDALDRAGVPYESRFFPNSGHGLRGSSTTQWEFFDRVLKPK